MRSDHRVGQLFAVLVMKTSSLTTLTIPPNPCCQGEQRRWSHGPFSWSTTRGSPSQVALKSQLLSTALLASPYLMVPCGLCASLLTNNDFPLLCCCSVIKSCLTLCDPTDCSMPSFPVLHCLPESTHIHVHQVGDAIQPSHPLSSPSPPIFNLSQHQGLFQ